MMLNLSSYPFSRVYLVLSMATAYILGLALLAGLGLMSSPAVLVANVLVATGATLFVALSFHSGEKRWGLRRRRHLRLVKGGKGVQPYTICYDQSPAYSRWIWG